MPGKTNRNEFKPHQIAKIRSRWKNDPTFLGYPDAERDSRDKDLWMHHLLVRPNWFVPAIERKGTIIIGRKGVGKSAARIAAVSSVPLSTKRLVVELSADELAAKYAHRLEAASARGFGSVSDWCQVYAEVILQHIASDLTGRLIVDDDKAAIRKWGVINGITERDFGEKLSAVISSLVPWAKKVLHERGDDVLHSEERFTRVASAQAFTLYIDDFDNLQEQRGYENTRMIRDAVEAADRITSQSSNASVHLLMRQDLWLRIKPGWHYADKVAGYVELNWTQDNLRQWAKKRLIHAAATALEVEPGALRDYGFHSLWSIFYPDEISLRNDTSSTGLHYMVKRTMYTPRALRQFMQLVVEKSKEFPATLRGIEDAEEVFSDNQLEFMKTEYGGLCEGLGICLQSFTGKSMEYIASDLYRHLNGMIGNGQVKLLPGASDGDDKYALAHFLYRIGFLEVRYYDGERFEVRDAMRHPNHWRSIRQDDSVRWAVRSAFFCALRRH